MIATVIPSRSRRILALLAVLLAGSASAQSAGGFSQSLAAAVANDRVLTEFYASRGYQPIWMGGGYKDKQRVGAFFDALSHAGDQGLPVPAYRIDALNAAVKSARSPAEKARAEAMLSHAFAEYARDVQSGILTPSQVNSDIDRAAPRRGQAGTLAAFSKSSPKGFLNSLPPQSSDYKALLKEKAQLERALGAGGWGPKVGAALKPGVSSQQVVVLRNRLAALGYGRTGTSPVYDAGLQQVVARFQLDHGLAADGVAGSGTIAEINKDPADRLKQVIVAMERERWMNYPLGQRYVWVNIPDFTAEVVDNGRIVFATRVIVGQNQSTHRTPEFSDMMEMMVVNPTWNVPYSIATREYLPMLKQNPNSVGNLVLTDQAGNRVSRSSVNFANYSESNFPFRLTEPPSEGNALGEVKFLFPNPHNIYLHDTPTKSLFARNPRMFSHGCIRVADPQALAYVLLSRQTSNPQGLYQSKVATGRETVITLQPPVPVHLVYFTAFQAESGAIQYRPDVYGRDAQVFQALARAGVSLRAAGG
ncbi:MAG: L,D-transpeptidase family protein [Rhodobacteraceae bacterium]|nr:L,D-transpeptidase family protein [Paracoccaceae bacterium]